jgi:hypothetical protein
LVAFAAPAARAEGPNLLTDPFYVALGTYILESDTEVRLDGDTTNGTPVDWERALGDDGDQTRFRIDGYWRFADRHKMRFLWFNSATSNSRSLEDEIEWGGVTYPVDAEIKAESNFDIYEIAYEYAFLKRENYELSGTIGLHWTTMSLALEGEASIVGGEPHTGSVRKEGSVDLPLPVFGLRGLWNLTHDFWIDASVQYFTLSIDEYDGSVTDWRAAFLWQPNKWVGLGAGYNQFNVDVDLDKDRFKGQLDWTYKGPMIFYSIAF